MVQVTGNKRYPWQVIMTHPNAMYAAELDNWCVARWGDYNWEYASPCECTWYPCRNGWQFAHEQDALEMIITWNE